MPAAPPSAPTRRGACPGVFDPMETADGWLVRIRVPSGRIDATQLRVVAGLAERFGTGVVEVTSRANLQLRGIAESALAEVGPILAGAGLVAADAAADVRRAVVASPLAGHDPHELVDVSAVADAVLDALAAAALPPLPAKFGVVIDGGGAAGVRDVPGTICLGAVAAPGAGAACGVSWQAAFGTSLAAGPTVHLGPVSAAGLAAAVVDAARTAAGAAGSIAGPEYRNRPPQPAMADPGDCKAAADGPTAAPQGRFRHQGAAVHQPTHADDRADDPTAAPQGRFRHQGAAVDSGRPAIGVLAHRVAGRANVVARAFVGRTDAAAIAAVADLAGLAHAVRTMPGGVVLLGVTDADVVATVDALAWLGFVVDPDDARVGITACVGAPGCASARADTAAAATLLADGRRSGDTRQHFDPETSALRSQRSGHRLRHVPPPIHLAACEKRCGAPSGVTVLVADEGGRFREHGPGPAADETASA